MYIKWTLNVYKMYVKCILNDLAKKDPSLQV